MAKSEKETQPAADPSAEMNTRVQLFDVEFQAIQKKYMLRVVAQVVLPGGAVLSVPIQVFPIDLPPATEKPAEQATKVD